MQGLYSLVPYYEPGVERVHSMIPRRQVGFSASKGLGFRVSYPPHTSVKGKSRHVFRPWP